MERSAVEGFGVRERVVRRLLGERVEVAPGLVVVGWEGRRGYAVKRSNLLSAHASLEKELGELEARSGSSDEPDVSTIAGCQALQRLRHREKKLEQLRSCIRASQDNFAAAPVYGSDLRELLTVKSGRCYRSVAKDFRGRLLGKPLRGWPVLGSRPLQFDMGPRFRLDAVEKQYAATERADCREIRRASTRDDCQVCILYANCDCAYTQLLSSGSCPADPSRVCVVPNGRRLRPRSSHPDLHRIPRLTSPHLRLGQAPTPPTPPPRTPI